MKTGYLQASQTSTSLRHTGPVRRTVITRCYEAVRAIALCHNVTPVYENENGMDNSSETEVDQQSHQKVVYQASSPDEVEFCCFTCNLLGISNDFVFLVNHEFFFFYKHVYCFL